MSALPLTSTIVRHPWADGTFLHKRGKRPVAVRPERLLGDLLRRDRIAGWERFLHRLVEQLILPLLEIVTRLQLTRRARRGKIRILGLGGRTRDSQATTWSTEHHDQEMASSSR